MRMLDGTVKTMLVDDSQIVSNLMVTICTKIGESAPILVKSVCWCRVNRRRTVCGKLATRDIVWRFLCLVYWALLLV